MTSAKPSALPPAAPANEQDASNRRDNTRNVLVAKATITTPAPGSEVDKSKSVWLFNISEGGVGFRGNQSLEPGSIHHIKVEAGPFQLNNRIRIAWTRKRDDNTIESGGEFLPPADK